MGRLGPVWHARLNTGLSHVTEGAPLLLAREVLGPHVGSRQSTSVRRSKSGYGRAPYARALEANHVARYPRGRDGGRVGCRRMRAPTLWPCDAFTGRTSPSAILGISLSSQAKRDDLSRRERRAVLVFRATGDPIIRNAGAPWALAFLGAATVVSMRTTTEERNLSGLASSTWISKPHMEHSDSGIELDAASEDFGRGSRRTPGTMHSVESRGTSWQRHRQN